MNYKYLLLVITKNGLETYFTDNIAKLTEYAKIRKFDNYKIFELREVGDK